MAKDHESLPDQQLGVICSNRTEKYLRSEFHVCFLGTVISGNKGKGPVRTNGFNLSLAS